MIDIAGEYYKKIIEEKDKEIENLKIKIEGLKTELEYMNEITCLTKFAKRQQQRELPDFSF